MCFGGLEGGFREFRGLGVRGLGLRGFREFRESMEGV